MSKPKKRDVLFYKTFWIEPQFVKLWVVVNDRPQKALREFKDIFGKQRHNYAALHSWNNRGDFGIFFRKGLITTRYVAHEVFHATHRIMEFSGDDFAANHHEPYSHLNGYLSHIVTRAILKAGFKIKS
jgi:hypothetical protein